MAGLVAFITARLDEDQAAAERATPGPWHQDGSAIRGSARPAAPSITDTLVVTHTWAPEAAHIVQHDPARVLRDVAASRDVLGRHARCGYGTGFCGDGGHSFDDDLGCWELVNLAQRWSDHPDFDQAWTG